MIKSIKDKETAKVYKQQFSSKIPGTIQKTALRKLIMIDKARTINDLRVPPGNRLEILDGDRAGQYSVRINEQYRICFTFDNGHAFDVEIVDYH